MTELTEQLRELAQHHEGFMLSEAAAEIERLQSALTESALQVLAHSTQEHEAWEDACRYRWLRDVARSVDWTESVNGWSWNSYCRIGARGMDAAIDAARKDAP